MKHAAVLGLAFAAAAAGCSPGARTPNPPEHVLLVTLSGVRPDHTSAYSYRRPTTGWPVDGAQQLAGRALALDDIAAAGVLFSEAWAPAEDVISSLKVLMTGRASPLREVVTGLLDERVTLAERFHAAGFHTAAFVTGPELAVIGGFQQGFDQYQHRPTDADCLEWAGKWLFEHDSGTGRPLFLWLHLSGPQAPWTPGSVPPMPGREAMGLDYVRLLFDREYAASLDAVDYDVLYAGGSQDPVDRYDGEVAELGSRLRSFLLAFKTLGEPSGVWDDTAIVIAGLAGAELGEHGWSSSIYAPAVRVPLVVHHPASAPGTRVLSQLVQLTDLAPTLLDWLDVKAPPFTVRAGIGRSLVPLLSERGDVRPRPALTVAGGGLEAGSLRDPRWTLVWEKDATTGEERTQLFDRVRDPLELDDLAALDRERARRMRMVLMRTLSEVKP
jgi:arylsulfatase A-like enzyme